MKTSIAMQKRNYTEVIILCLTILVSLNFFDIKYLQFDSKIGKFVYYGLIVIMFVYTRLNSGKNKVRAKSSMIKWLFRFLFFSFGIAAINAYRYNNQELEDSIVAALQYVTYVYFFVLLGTKFKVKDLENISDFFSILFVIITLINMLLPDPLFGHGEFDLDRGGYRYRLPGIYFVFLSFLIHINRLSKEICYKDVLWVLLTFLAIFSSLTRQIIFVSVLVGGLLYFYNTRWTKKIVFVFVSIVLFSIVERTASFEKFTNLTKNQIAQNEVNDDIRILSFEYYTSQNKNTMQFLFGNGVPAEGKSRYGNTFYQNQRYSNLYFSDVGWAGFYFFFGLVGVVILTSIILYQSSKKKYPEIRYSSYFCFSYLVLSIASAPILIQGQIMPLMIGLYICELGRVKKLHISSLENYEK